MSSLLDRMTEVNYRGTNMETRRTGMTDEEKIQKVLDALVGAAEAGDILDPQSIWEAIEERPAAFLSDDAMLSFEALRP